MEIEIKFDECKTVQDVNILSRATKEKISIVCNVAGGLTQFRPFKLISNNVLNANIAFDAEL